MTTTVDIFDLVQAVGKVRGSAYLDDDRPALKCILFEADDQAQTVRLSCANGFMMARTIIPGKVEEPFRKMVPARAFDFMSAHRLQYFPLKMVLDPESMQSADSYPLLENVLPSRLPIFSCDVPKLVIDGVRRLNKFYGKDLSILHWSFSKSGYVLEVVADKATSRYECLAELENIPAPFSFAVNLPWLAQILASASVELELCLSYHGPGAPVEFSANFGKGRWIVMPMRNDGYEPREVRHDH